MRGGPIEYAARRLKRILVAPIQSVIRKIRRGMSPEAFINQVMGDVRKSLFKKDKKQSRTLKDYFSVGNYYVLKKMVYIVLFLLVMLPILYVKLLHPVIVSKFLTKTMIVNSEEMIGYSGKVKLMSEKNDTLLFQGEMTEGRINGIGQLYDYSGALLYDGNFEMEAYSGEGELYYTENGQLCYKGSFLLNQYEGQGMLYDKAGNLVYKGQFKNGLYEGDGTLYYKNGQVQYEGAFVKGEMQGTGTLYDEEGNVIAEGEFQGGEPLLKKVEMLDEEGNLLYEGTVNSDGEYEGEGKLYEDGVLAYEGDFVDGKKEGEGKEYDSTGEVSYEGAFVNGQREGEGKLYEEGKLVYDGEFIDGKKEGHGKEYNAEGVLIYDGTFARDKYEGDGKLYDATTGGLIYTGAFSNGQYQGVGILTDPETQNLIYNGEFYQGKYSGAGKQYDVTTKLQIYDGQFLNGAYDGQGSLWDQNGNLLYVGNFVAGVYSGSGTLYDPATGRVISSGEFRNGALVMDSDEVEVKYGVITCIVTDSDGKPVSNVTVNLSDGQGSVTDANGRAVFANHALGTYRVTIEVPSGYTCTNPVQSVTLTKGSSTVEVKKVLTKNM